MPPNDPLATHADQWVNINDFSPGIISHDHTTSTADRLLAAPLGAADPAGTYACMALPSGGLGALPGVVNTYTWTPAAGSGTNYLVGFLAHDEMANSTTEVIAIVEWDDGTNHYWRAYSYIPDTTTATSIVSTSEASAAGIFGAPYPQLTRVNLATVASCTLNGTATITNSAAFAGATVGAYVQVMSSSTSVSIPADTTVLSIVGTTMTLSAAVTGNSTTATLGFSSPTTAGQPVVVFPGGFANPAANGSLYIYPNPTTPTSYTPLNLINNASGSYSSVTGQVIVHQSRIIALTGVVYQYPAGTGFNVNENIDYTDPPNSPFYTPYQTVLSNEQPFGYGAAGSIYAGELFLVKKRGGAVVVQGDIFSPNVTFLPGVQSTGGFYGRGDSGLAGFAYCSWYNGAWLWNGGNVATKISTQLDDNFFLPTAFGAMASNNYGYYVQAVGDKIYFSNNYVYDTVTGSWWIYYPRTSQGGTDLFYINPISGQYLFAAPISFTGAAGTWLYQFDTGTPAQTYQWTSLPITLGDKDRLADIREVIVRASSTATADTQITLSIINNGATVWGPSTQTGTLNNGPQKVRFNVAALGVGSPQVQVKVVYGSYGDMAVIHSIEIKYKPRAHVASTN